MTREENLKNLREYNKEEFHILHGLTVEGVMKWYANELGYGDEQDYWASVGLLHDIDFELYPDEHCVKAVEILQGLGYEQRLINSVCSHGYGICADIEPEHEMEKVLFATDELTGIIGASARMRPSKSTLDMDVSSLKKKYKNKKFAAGCSREIIDQGAQMLGWDIQVLLEKTLSAMKAIEEDVNKQMSQMSF